MRTFIKRNFMLTLALFAFILNSCTEAKSTTEPTDEYLIKISIFSDPHFYDNSLGTSGEAFENYLASDRKMIAESEAIMKSIVNMISKDDSKIVIVTGDLTKDGELKSHQLFVSYLKQLKDKGKKIFVVPGNHDIENPASYSYTGSAPVKVPNVSAEQYKSIYADYGYKNAIATDPNGSLSYIAEPVDGVWLFCLDACRWKDNAGKPHSVTGGVFSAATFNWIKEKLTEGKQKKKLMIGAIHHNVVEHFVGQKMLFGEYVIDNWEQVAKTFAENGLSVIFSGHHHAQDARIYRSGGNFMVDLQTSSSVTWPCAIRRVSIDNNRVMQVSSEKITSINYDTKGRSFQEYALHNFTDGLSMIIQSYLKQMGLPDEAVSMLLPIVLEAYKAYSHGNEDQFYTQDIQMRIAQAKAAMGSNPQLAGLLMLMEGMFQDLDPDDYNFTLDLKTGEIGKKFVEVTK
ncbi:MAG: metallophosphoesterase [Ignavibacteria bacterium]|nr:metallophosphoesterase [Ignavibacteria bacterium]